MHQNRFATRAWLHEQHGRLDAARDDAKKGIEWLMRTCKARPMTEEEGRKGLERFDVWLERAKGERGFLTAAHVLAHALQVLVLYRQFGTAGDQDILTIPPEEFTTRLDSGVGELRRRIESW